MAAESGKIDPMHQFLIQKIWDGPVFQIGGLTFDMSITNSVVAMFVGAAAMVLFFALSAKGQVVPNRAQAAAEGLYNIVDRVLVTPIIGEISTRRCGMASCPSPSAARL